MENEQKTKRKFYKKWWFWLICVVVVLIIGGSMGSKNSVNNTITNSQQSVPAVNNQQVNQPVQNKPIQTLLDISGSGSKSTQKFIVNGDWDLSWSYDCTSQMASVGGQGNFQVYIYNGDGSLSLQNNLINQLGKSDSGVENYHTGGTYYLQVNSVCSWKIKVNG